MMKILFLIMGVLLAPSALAYSDQSPEYIVLWDDTAPLRFKEMYGEGFDVDAEIAKIKVGTVLVFKQYSYANRSRDVAKHCVLDSIREVDENIICVKHNASPRQRIAIP